MKVHHLNCGTMRPFGGRLVSGRGSAFATAEMVCHCLLIETDNGLVLVDSGMGLDDVRTPSASLARAFRTMSRPVLDESETAIRQVERLGFAASDVRHVVLTHLDQDHAGGLRDFPDAEVHLLRDELDEANSPTSRLSTSRYRTAQWSHGPNWVTHTAEGEPWFGFQAVRGIEGLPADILLVPLIGHTRGHTGVAVRADDKWLLHAGDSYFFHGEMKPEPHCTPALVLMQKMMETVRDLRLSNQDRLRELASGGEVDVFSAHDPVELRRHQSDQIAPGQRS